MSEVLPKRRGRPAKYKDAAEKQKAYRDRRKQSGLPADTRERLISSLRDDINRLQSVAAATKEVTTLQKLIRELEHSNYDLEYQKSKLASELELAKFRKSDRIYELLAGKNVMQKRDLSAIFMTNYIGNPIEHADEYDRATKRALEFGRKAATAASAIREIVAVLERKSQTTTEEKSILDAACRILGDIHSKSTRIKENAKSTSKQIKRDEELREKEADKALALVFKNTSSEAVLLALYLEPHSFALNRLVRMRPETVSKSDLDYQFEDLLRNIRHDLQQRIVKALKDGKESNASALALRAAFEEAVPALDITHRTLIENIRVCRVAAELRQASKSEHF